MQHSVREIGNNYERLSLMRNDRNRFKAADFLQFAKDNKGKYGIIESGEDLLVSTWHSDSLIKDYQLKILT